MATIDRRKATSGKISYRVRVRLKGCPVQTATFSRKTDAKKWVQDIESSIREGRYFKTAEAKKHTFGEMIDRFKSNELPKLPKVKGFMGPQLDWWKNQLGVYTLADVTTAMIVECRDKLLRDGTPSKKVITPATVNRYLAALSLTYTRAVNEWEWVENNPLRKVKKLNSTPQDLPSIIKPVSVSRSGSGSFNWYAQKRDYESHMERYKPKQRANLLKGNKKRREKKRTTHRPRPGSGPEFG